MTKHNPDSIEASGDPLLELEALTKSVPQHGQSQKHIQKQQSKIVPPRRFSLTGFTIVASPDSQGQQQDHQEEEDQDPRPKLDLLLLTRRLFTGLRDDPATRTAAKNLIQQIKADYQRELDNWRKRHGGGDGGQLHLNCPSCRCGDPETIETSSNSSMSNNHDGHEEDEE
jgi:hypothetical protein